jgi:hypothetical protein
MNACHDEASNVHENSQLHIFINSQLGAGTMAEVQYILHLVTSVSGPLISPALLI